MQKGRESGTWVSQEKVGFGGARITQTTCQASSGVFRGLVGRWEGEAGSGLLTAALFTSNKENFFWSLPSARSSCCFPLPIEPSANY